MFEAQQGIINLDNVRIAVYAADGSSYSVTTVGGVTQKVGGEDTGDLTKALEKAKNLTKLDDVYVDLAAFAFASVSQTDGGEVSSATVVFTDGSRHVLGANEAGPFVKAIGFKGDAAKRKAKAEKQREKEQKEADAAARKANEEAQKAADES